MNHLDEFVSQVSHEMRTPITAMEGALGLLTAGAVGELPKDMQSLTDAAYRNAQTARPSGVRHSRQQQKSKRAISIAIRSRSDNDTDFAFSTLAFLLQRQIEPKRGAGGFADALPGRKADCAACCSTIALLIVNPSHTGFLIGIGLPELLKDMRLNSDGIPVPPVGHSHANELLVRLQLD